MYRSASTTRVTDELYNPASPTTDLEKLPLYNPDSHVDKKEKLRLRSAENAVHLIPLVLLACALILWLSSKPVDITIVTKGSSVIPSLKDLTLDGDIDSDGAQNSLLPNLELDDFDPRKLGRIVKPTRLMERRRKRKGKKAT